MNNQEAQAAGQSNGSKEIESEDRPVLSSVQPKPKKKTKGFKYSDAVGGIIGTVIWLWFVNSLEIWGFPILTDDWAQVLRIINITAVGIIITWFFLIFIHIRSVFYVGKTLNDGLNLWSTWVTVSVFPFDFAVWPGWEWAAMVLRIVLWVAFLAAFISILVRTLRFIIEADFN
ncbi:MAG: hypothetical protein Q8Q20_01295 [bacterium]|nr:hypothetical protein [bacterium]